MEGPPAVTEALSTSGKNVQGLPAGKKTMKGPPAGTEALSTNNSAMVSISTVASVLHPYLTASFSPLFPKTRLSNNTTLWSTLHKTYARSNVTFDLERGRERVVHTPVPRTLCPDHHSAKTRLTRLPGYTRPQSVRIPIRMSRFRRIIVFVHLLMFQSPCPPLPVTSSL